VKRVLAITPAFNEAAVLPEFVEKFSELRSTLQKSDVELKLLVVDDGSSDSTLQMIKESSKKTPDWFSYLSFSSNFGHQAALVAGLSRVSDWPDAVITLDCDLEHPLEKIPELINLWRENGYILVNTLRNTSASLPFFKKLFSKLFYRVTADLTGLDLKSGQADFRLWDAKLVRALKPYFDHIGSLRVFAAWLPGKKGELRYDQIVRRNRVTRFTFKKNWQLAIISIVRFSTAPLRFMTIAGVSGIAFACVYAIYTFAQFIRGRTVPGWSSLVLLIVFMGCLQLFSLGIIATYLQRLVFIKDLPPYLILDGSE
jgi:glycosyltransferase involved in cell wall biosynthesis